MTNQYLQLTSLLERFVRGEREALSRAWHPEREINGPLDLHPDDLAEAVAHDKRALSGETVRQAVMRRGAVLNNVRRASVIEAMEALRADLLAEAQSQRSPGLLARANAIQDAIGRIRRAIEEEDR